MVIAPWMLVLGSCALLGFRHGFDYDHIAAITDIAGIEAKPARTMRLGLMYALGHAATVAALGWIVIGFHVPLSGKLDPWFERLVGVTLIVLSLYVFSTLVRGARPRSRGALLLGAAGWVRRMLHRRLNGTALPQSTADVNGGTCFGIGILHGLGAETPSQLALFLVAGNLGGERLGFVGLGCFLLGLVTMNTLMTASAAGLFTAGRGWRGWAPVLTGLAAAYSFVIGVVFLAGASGSLRNIAG